MEEATPVTDEPAPQVVEEEEAPRRGRKTAPTPKTETPKPRSKRGKKEEEEEEEVEVRNCIDSFSSLYLYSYIDFVRFRRRRLRRLSRKRQQLVRRL